MFITLIIVTDLPGIIDLSVAVPLIQFLAGVFSYLCLAIFVEAEVNGVLFLKLRHPYVFGTHD